MHMQPEDFESLSQHLTALDPEFGDFAKRHGFETQLAGLGRYPRRRLVRRGSPCWFIDLQMDLRPDGGYYLSFNPSLPYSMAAGAWIDQGNWRFSKRTWCFRSIPFVELERILSAELETSLMLIRNWDSEYLQRNGERTVTSVAE